MTIGASECNQDEIIAWLRLLNTPGIGTQTALRLLAAFGLPQEILAQSYSALLRHCSEATARALLATPSNAMQELTARTLKWLQEPGNYLLHLADKAYPSRLLEIADPPPLLYVRGNPAILAQASLAIVGSRHASLQGGRDAFGFAQTLAAELVIVSGLAVGIDAAAHRGALAATNGQTIAVVGTGIDSVYPPEHTALAEEIAQKGALVSEFPLGMPPLKHHFPRRNRIIAGLAAGVLVVEAAARSGSLITARLATEAGREVFAVPGSIHSPLFKGCHTLIKQGAKLSESAADILQELRLPMGSVTVQPNTINLDDENKSVSSSPLIEASWAKRPSVTSPLPVGDDLNKVLSACDWSFPLTVDEICLRCDLDIVRVTTLLLQLELDGRVEVIAGGRYRLLS